MKKKLLIVTPRFPYPVVGGDRVRIYQICRVLAKRYDLTLLSICQTDAEMHAAPEDDGVFCKIERIYLPRWRSWLNCAFALFSRIPLQIAYFRSSKVALRVDQLAREHAGAIAHLIRAGQFIASGTYPRFLEMTDAVSMNYAGIRENLIKSGFGLKALLFALEAPRLRKYEQEISRCFNATFLISEVDRLFLFGTALPESNRVIVCSNGVDSSKYPYAFARGSEDIVFIGNMLSFQNLDAARYMVSQIFPLVRQSRPKARLRLIGRISAKSAKMFSSIPGVVATGEVPSIAVAAEGGAVGVCPVRFGAGVQNKLLEYMALGLPAVTTSLGLEGITAVPGEQVFVADSPQDFAQSIVHLLVCRREAEIVAENARQFIEKHHSWDAVLASWVSTVEETLTSWGD
jgi:glycosyltransferase involved in cell wall biosynthesis